MTNENKDYKTLDKTEHRGGFSSGYIREEFPRLNTEN